MKFRFIALATSLLSIAACADSPQMPLAPDEVRLSANEGSNGVVQSISGNADIEVPEGLRRMNVQARKAADGSVTGLLTIRQEWDGGTDFEAEIVCFTIVGSKAYVGALLKSLNGVPFNGYYAYRLVMEDNGEGSGAPDRSSRLFDAQQAGQPQLFCNNASLVLPMFDLTRGNLQIRP